MRMVAVESSTIAAVGYDAARKLLEVEFSSGAVYHYFDVPSGMHQSLLSASSKGTFFNRNIRSRFAHRRIPECLWAQQAIAVVRGRE